MAATDGFGLAAQALEDFDFSAQNALGFVAGSFRSFFRHIRSFGLSRITVKKNLYRKRIFGITEIQMSLFGTKLRDLMGEKNLTLEDVRKVSGLSVSILSEIRRGTQPTVSRENAENIIRAFKGDRAAELELAMAHLWDELPAQGKGRIQISSEDGPQAVKELPDSMFGNLGADFEDAIRRIRQAIPNNDDLRLCVIDLANAVCEDRVSSDKTGPASHPGLAAEVGSGQVVYRKRRRRPL